MEYAKPISLTLLPHLGGFLGGFITRKNVKNWYDKEMVKPDWRPPNWAFGPVWTTLYTGMGYASYLVYRDGGGLEGPASTALSLYAAQLALNWSWTPVFFGAKQVALAGVIIVGLLGTTMATAYFFYPINRTAAYLMMPYIAWVGLASALNWSVFFLNRPKNKPE